MPAIYMYYNSFFFALLFWSAHVKDRNLEPLIMAAVINGVAIALDIICITTTYELAQHLPRYEVSLV